MPIERSPLNKKEEKRDYKQEFLDMVANQSGPLAAATMADALKHQNKQMEEAMLQGGMSIADISQTVAKQVGMPPQGGTEPIQKKGNFWYQPFEMNQQTGQVTPASILGGLISQHPQDVEAMAKANKINSGAMESPSLIAQREANTALMNKQIEAMESGKGVDKVYRDPITGQEVDPEQAQSDMEQGLGVYQVNQKVIGRSGVQEKPLNKVPDLTQEEKKYVNDARRIGKSLVNLETEFDKLYSKFGKANWQSFQMEKMPYILTQDQDVQSLKSELNYLKADIPFLRGGKQLTPTEAKRVDTMLNPFGKSKETFKKDIARFEEEFMTGAEITKYGINAGLMKRLIKTDRKKQQVQEIQSQGWTQDKEARYQELLKKRGQ